MESQRVCVGELKKGSVWGVSHTSEVSIAGRATSRLRRARSARAATSNRVTPNLPPIAASMSAVYSVGVTLSARKGRRV